MSSNPPILRTVCGQIEGRPVEAFELSGGQTRVRVMTYGAILSHVFRPDRDGRLADIVLGYDDPADYVTNRGNAGAICGRCANRLAGAAFTLNGQRHHLTANDGENHLHGGLPGFGKRFWTPHVDAEQNAVRFDIESADGDQGYPGTLKASVTYAVTPNGDLSIQMRANTDAPTIVNLVQHGYWNLTGHDSGSVLDQILQINASQYTPVSPAKIPTGERAPVSGTPYDFSTAKPIGRDIEAAWADGGYDHNLCHTIHDGQLQPSARAIDPASGRGLQLLSNQPGIQLYTANHYGAFPTRGKGGAIYNKYAGFALETQGFPNAPNTPRFPSVTLNPDETYRHDMLVQFFTLPAGQS